MQAHLSLSLKKWKEKFCQRGEISVSDPKVHSLVLYKVCSIPFGWFCYFWAHHANTQLAIQTPGCISSVMNTYTQMERMQIIAFYWVSTSTVLSAVCHCKMCTLVAYLTLFPSVECLKCSVMQFNPMSKSRTLLSQLNTSQSGKISATSRNLERKKPQTTFITWSVKPFIDSTCSWLDQTKEIVLSSRPQPPQNIFVLRKYWVTTDTTEMFHWT